LVLLIQERDLRPQCFHGQL